MEDCAHHHIKEVGFPMPTSRLLTIASLNFFTIGIVAALLGPALPDLAHQTHSPLVAVGGVISALFVGALIAQIIGGPLNDRMGAAPLMRIGLACLGLGLGGLALSHSLIVTLICGVIMGLGHGTVDISTNVLVSVASGEHNVVALNLINVFFGAGAVAGPAMASGALYWWHTTLPVFWLSALLAVGLIPFMALLPPQRTVPRTPEVPTPPRALWHVPLLWILGGIFLIYVGLENGMSGWISVYIQRTTPAGLSVGALIAASFWLALTGGRILATAFGGRFSASTLLVLSVGTVLVGGIVLAASTGNLMVTILATAIIGLGCGPIFPTALAMTTDAFAQSPGLAASIVIALGSLGGILIPWLQGVILTQGHAQLSSVFVALLAGGMVLLSWDLWQKARAKRLLSLSRPTPA